MFYIYDKKKKQTYVSNQALAQEQIRVFIHKEKALDADVEKEDSAGQFVFGENEQFYQSMVQQNILTSVLIEGRSMVPSFVPGEQAIIRGLARPYKPGDILVFYSMGRLIIHRVVFDGIRTTTKGDNCKDYDDFFHPGAVIGIVCKRKASISKRIKWSAYYMKKRKIKKGIGVLLACFAKIG